MEVMEAEWTPQMMQVLGIDAASLPIIWDLWTAHRVRRRQLRPTRDQRQFGVRDPGSGTRSYRAAGKE
jgi:hypothetical protein